MINDKKADYPRSAPVTMKIGKTEYTINIEYRGKMDISKKIKDLIIREIEREIDNENAF